MLVDAGQRLVLHCPAHPIFQEHGFSVVIRHGVSSRAMESGTGLAVFGPVVFDRVRDRAPFMSGDGFAEQAEWIAPGIGSRGLAELLGEEHNRSPLVPSVRVSPSQMANRRTHTSEQSGQGRADARSRRRRLDFIVTARSLSSGARHMNSTACRHKMRPEPASSRLQ